MNRQWMEDRRGVVDERLRALDFFGFALESTPWREEFWPAYELLADTIFSLRQTILACMEADDTRDAMHSAYHSRCMSAAQHHVDETAVALSRLAKNVLVRRTVEERGPGLAWLYQLDRDHQAPQRDPLEARWDELLRAYQILFERVRWASIAHPTGEMDQ